MALIDADQELLAERATDRFAGQVEAVRAGTIFAHDQKAYDRWRAEAHGQVKTLRDLARDLGGNGVQVVHDGFEFRKEVA